MNFNSLQLAFSALQKNKGRTALTITGIVIGITAVITVLSTGQAISDLIIGEVEAFGSNYIQIEVKTPSTSQTSAENAFSMVGGAVITTMKEKDGEKIGEHPNIDKWYAAILGQEIASYKNEIKKAMLFGVNADFIDIDSSEVEYGRFFTEEENKALSKSAVLGRKIADNLFGQNDPLGRSIKIGKESFRVIGILEERGASFSLDMDNMIIIPLNTLQKRILGVDYVSFILAQTINNDLAAQTKEDIEIIMREQHDITDPDKDDFAVTTMEDAMEMLDIIIYGVQLLLILLGSISLIVGGVGIMNIMYVSVTERTYEIGLRKALGAKSKDILWQFMWEAVMLTLAGGIIGILLGISLSYLVSVGAQSQGYDWTFSISLTGLALALTMSSVVGLTFGLYPAKKAANLNPIEALRKE